MPFCYFQMRQIKNDKRLSAWLFAARNVCLCVGEETNDIKEQLRFPAFSGCKFEVCVCVLFATNIRILLKTAMQCVKRFF